MRNVEYFSKIPSSNTVQDRTLQQDEHKDDPVLVKEPTRTTFRPIFVSFYSFDCTFTGWQTTCVNFTTVTFASFSPVGNLDFVVVVSHFVVESFRL